MIGEGIVWMTTAIETAAPAAVAEKFQAARRDRQPITVCARVEFYALGVDLDSGKLRHRIFLFARDDPQPIHALNSFASPTPVWKDGRLYCHFGTYGTCCLDTRTGKRRWLNQSIQIQHENGPGSSPVLWKNKLIVHFDGSDQQWIVAFDADSGRIAWKTARSGKLRDVPDFRKAYGTPLIMPVAGKMLVISPAADWVYAYDPDTGKEA